MAKLLAMTVTMGKTVFAVLAVGVCTLGAPPGLRADTGPQPLTLEPLANLAQETKTVFKFQARAKSARPAPLRFTIARLRKDGQAAAVPATMKLVPDTGAFSWTPTPSQAGVYELTLAVKDARKGEATTTLRLTVRARSICTAAGPVGDLLRKWYAAGTAAGHTGDFYDNRDRDHSALNLAPYPQLDQVTYTAEQRKVNFDWAAQKVLRPEVTFGNSSTSAPVLFGGSNVRFYYTHPRGMDFLYQEYRKNNLYMYPAHHDHHPGHNGKPFYGDVFPANSPYLITSQGSSGTDQPFMRAVAFTLAAFRPEVKEKLKSSGLLMPTLQMIFRSSNKHLAAPKEYLTGKAHPPVFEGSWVDDLKMVQAAHALRLNNLPPMIQLKVVDEDAPVAGKDYFEPGKSEKLCDTPAAIARVVRGGNYLRRLVVSAEGSFDLHKKPLTYHWAVLRGDARRIQIKPRNAAASVVEILVPYHERRKVNETSPLESNRVDIGAFVHNGTYYSAPGLITFFSLDNEARTYDSSGRLLEIGYGAGDADLTVSDWSALFEALDGKAGALAARLFQQQLTVKELADLRKAGAEYRPLHAALRAAQEKSRQADQARSKAHASLAQAGTVLQAAQKAHQHKPSAETLAALKRATAGRAAAEDERKRAEAVVVAAQKETAAATRTAEDFLNRTGVKALLERALNKIKDNPTFYALNREAVEALSRAAPAAERARFTAARKRLARLGILKEQGGRWNIHPLRQGAQPLGERLTRYEKNMLERFNAEGLSALVYPKCVRSAFTVNFVDQRVSTPKEWRDIYRYDSRGNKTGWTRYHGTAEVQEFTPEGLVSLEKDGRGRVLKARTVKYELDPATRQSVFGRVRQVWGNQIVHYEYQGDDDRKGRIKNTETVAEKP